MIMVYHKCLTSLKYKVFLYIFSISYFETQWCIELLTVFLDVVFVGGIVGGW